MRTLKYYGRARSDLPDGCPERFSLEFIKWIWNSRNTSRMEMDALFESAPFNKEKIKLTDSSDVKAYLADVNNSLSLF